MAPLAERKVSVISRGSNSAGHAKTAGWAIGSPLISWTIFATVLTDAFLRLNG